MKCPSCQHELEDNVPFNICPYCGATVKKEEKQPTPVINETANYQEMNTAVQGQKTTEQQTGEDKPAEAQPASQVTTTEVKIPPVNTGHKNILLVEDDTAINDLYRIYMQKAGFEVKGASNAEEAASLMQSNNFDLILLDIMLPDRSGLEILQDIKTDPKTSGVPVLIMSNLDDKKVMDHAAILGADKYLIKARITIDDLLTEVYSIFGQAG